MIAVQKYPLSLLGVWLLGIVALLVRSLQLADGNFIYTIDDPYIHLAVAENILRGGYGINLGEHSSPSSSLLYPFLLAITEALQLGAWGPLVLNLLAMGSAVYLLGRILETHVWAAQAREGKPTSSKLFQLGVGLLFCGVMNTWAIVFTGMEHSLHVLASLLVFQGFLAANAGASEPALRPGARFVLALIALPLLRFEGLALALLAIAFLLYRKQWRSACTVLATLALAFLGWYLFTKAMGLPSIPSSVQIKSDIAAKIGEQRGLSQFVASIFETIAVNTRVAFLSHEGKGFLVALALNLFLLFQQWNGEQRKKVLEIGGLAFLVGVAHLLFGRFGMARYETYAVILVALACFVLCRSQLENRRWRIGTVLLLLFLARPYLILAWYVPAASQNIYQQQYQMHRFVVEYWEKPVAVNDLGWVSYRNPEYVLDLWGLGSEDARHILGSEMTRLRRMHRGEGGTQANELANLVDQKGVMLIMIYDKWFGRQTPSQWQKVATLVTPKISAAEPEVSFYITQSADRQAVLDLLRQFAPTLPRDVELKIR